MARKEPFIRSMFIRRLWLLFGLLCVGFLALGLRAFYVAAAHGGEFRQIAESRLVRERWTPTVRGRILDRKGRVLAADQPGFDVLVDYRMITGEWAYSQAAAQARKENRDRWGKLGRDAREELIAAVLPDWEQRAQSMWELMASALGVPRAMIEQRKSEIKAAVQQTAATVYEQMLIRRREELNRDREAEAEVSLGDVAQPLSVQREPHAIARGVGEDVAFRVRRLAEAFPGIELEAAGARIYPLESVTVEVDRRHFPKPEREGRPDTQTVVARGVGTHVLGWIRPVQAEDLAARGQARLNVPTLDASTGRRDPRHLREGDLVGAAGLEAALETRLRGARGALVEHLDTGRRETIEPVPGADVPLTIDAMLQARIQAVMDPGVGLARVQPWHSGLQRSPLPDGTPLNGAAVVLDIPTGEILAMVTTPTFTREELRRDPDRIWKDAVNAPWVNRAIGKPYPPGSIVKPLVLCAAVTAGLHRLDQGIVCTGHLLPDKPGQFRCWIYKQTNGASTHNDQFGHPLTPAEAMGVSCNIYFFTLGNRLGPGRITDWYTRFGVGRGFELGAGLEYPGHAGAGPSAGTGRAPRLFGGEGILMGIGQGPIDWTPLHAADAYATIARGGQRIVPRIVRDRLPKVEELHLDPAAVDAAMAGLATAVNESWGTGHGLKYADGEREAFFNVPGVTVWGKTGTAAAGERLVDIDGPEGTQVEKIAVDHSWFVVMAGPEGGWPRYAVAVVMENGGSGGRVSGPIADQILHALRAEGYL
ncbi:MAG: hypothetical protein IBJ11_02240 [Phycisphaerales bacterium]|nr:hypothetical protein [Phycisphaerales bacterium]